MNPRLRSVCDLAMAEAREDAGIHDYDGQVQDLSPSGVAAGLGRLGGPPEPIPHDDAHLGAFEESLRVRYGEIEEHRRNPLIHLSNLDLACYDREYAPAEDRADARRRHLSRWPDGVDAAVAALDQVAAPVAQALLPAVRGLASGVDDTEPEAGPALSAHARLVAHLEGVADHGPNDPAMGGSALARLLSASEATSVDLGRLGDRAEAELRRLRPLLAEACARLRPGVPPSVVVEELLNDHPAADAVLTGAAAQVHEVIAFTRERNLVPDLDGECSVGPAPPSRRWAMAMMSWAGPHEDDAPSWYHITPPDPLWPREQQGEWLAAFSRTILPVVTVHEVAPGHFAHGRALRRVTGDVRRTLFSAAFVEGWAHYAEELCLEEGFRGDDPRYAIGVAVEALVRVTRLAVSVGIHTRAMTMEEAVRRFRDDAFLRGPAAASEASRATFDPTYGRYTWGKLEILALRDEARARWGVRYSNPRFHAALLALGAPPLGLMGTAVAED